MAEVFRQRIPREKALEVLAKGGKLSEADYLRCVVGYFSDGAVLGEKNFVPGLPRPLRAEAQGRRASAARLGRRFP